MSGLGFRGIKQKFKVNDVTEFSSFLQNGANAWFFIPSAIFLGALHGLEPGHSKTMMAAFIVAIRGTVTQAVLLGLAATLSHTAIVWLLALPAAYFGSQWEAEASEPYFQLASGLLILVIAVWMLVRTWRQQHRHAHGHDHAQHTPNPGPQLLDTGHGIVRIDALEDADGWRVRIHPHSARTLSEAPESFRLEVRSAQGAVLASSFERQDNCLQSQKPLVTASGDSACLILAHGNHDHEYPVRFGSDAGLETEAPSGKPGEVEKLDPHARAHARDIRERFANRDITTWQVFLFGLTGGLIPCSAAIAVLLMCLQLKKVVLGAVLVLSFSVGLALTLIVSGAVAAVGVRQISRRWSGFDSFARRAPYFSGSLIILVGLYVSYHGVRGLLG